MISTQTQDHLTVQRSPTPMLGQYTTNILPSQNLFQTMTPTSLPCKKLGSDLTPPVPICPKSPHQVTICRGGGLGLFIKDGLDPSVVPTKTCTTFKNLLSKISQRKESFYFLNIYRPPSSSTPTFFEQFQSLLEDIHHITENLVIIGNFNFHLETTCSNSKAFHSLIDSFDLTQKVNFPTHIHRHTLDQVLTKSKSDRISNVHTTDAFSDHFSVSFTLNFSTPKSQTNATVTFHKYHKIDKEKMKTDLLASELINNPSKEDEVHPRIGQ